MSSSYTEVLKYEVQYCTKYSNNYTEVIIPLQ